VVRGDDITFTLAYPNGTVDKHLERVAHGAQQIQNATKGVFFSLYFRLNLLIKY
jgi:hypothetical protein